MGTLWVIAGVLAGVDPALLSGLCYVESTHQAQAYVANDGGSPSIGICQIKLASARQMGFEGSETELRDPRTNALYAALYLRWQYKRYRDWDKAISGYNAGRAIKGNASYVKRVREASWEKIRPVNVAAKASLNPSLPFPTTTASLAK